MKINPHTIRPVMKMLRLASIRIPLFKKFNLLILTATFICTVTISYATIPEMRWVLLPAGTNGTCVSNTDFCENTFCYGLEYTPGITGNLTSYTTAFFVDCVMGGSPIITNTSCTMIDQSMITNGCVDYNLIQINCSGNSGQLDITAGVPVIIHQVCFSLPPGVSLNVAEDEVTDLTTSYDLPDGNFGTEYPEYVLHTLVPSIIVTNANDNGAGSFRYLVDCAESGSTITFDISLTDQTITLTSGEIDIDKVLTVAGLGVADLVISGNNSSPVFHVLPGFDLTLKDIALKNASAPVNGGAIFAEGKITLQNVMLQNNFENGVPRSLSVTNTAIVQILDVVDFKN